MRGRPSRSDRLALAGLTGVLVLVSALTWRRWGVPAFDGGYDPSVASELLHGHVLYADVRYFYGPAGVYSLALAFTLAGTSFTVAYVFGYLQTVAILGSFYVLARTWLEPLMAALSTLALISLAFTGTFFDFVLPHTDSATFGLLFLILMLLAVTRGRLVLAGLAAGVVILTRPEFWIFAIACGIGAVAGALRDGGWRPALGALTRIALPALVLGGGTLALFSTRAGLHAVLFEDLVPRDFLRVTGNRLQGGWAPFDLASVVSTLARAAIAGGLIWGLLASAVLVSRTRGLARVRALWPLVLALVSLVLLGLLWHVVPVAVNERHEVWSEIKRLLISTAWLPLPAVAALVWAVRRAWRNELAPGVGWAADLALLVTAAACGLRAYDIFTTDSYAPYFAAAPIIVAAVMLERIGARWPQARTAARSVLVFVAMAMFVRDAALYRHRGVLIHSARGVYNGYTDGATGLQQTIDYVTDPARRPGPIVVLPDSPGMYFLLGRAPALADLTFLPGTLDNAEDERAAVAVLARSRAPLIVVGATRSDQYAFREIGVDYNRILFDYVRAHYRPVGRFGDVAHPTHNNLPPRAFTVWALI